MGQNSSKRRSAKGRSKNESHTISQTSNRDDPNVTIEAHQTTETGEGGKHPPTSPKSLASRSPSTASGKKEKRKRFRVGFSLNRTPSGRWSRKKKSPIANGTRPVSSPGPLRPEPDHVPSRPLSLFLDELEIPEEDTKVETVDLSDNEEENKPKTTQENKSPPKAPERSKWRRDSNKNSSGKNKKKDKQPVKKDIKKKRKAEVNLPDTARTNTAIPTAIAVDVSNTDELKNEGVSKECAKEVLKTKTQKQEDADVTAIASSIVAQTLEVAQTRLRAEVCNDKPCSLTSDRVVEHVNPQIDSFQRPNSTEITAKPMGGTQLKIGEETIKQPEVREQAHKEAQDVAQSFDKYIGAIPEPSQEIDFNETEPRDDIDVEENKPERASSLSITNNYQDEQIVCDRSEKLMTSYHFQNKTDNVCLENPEYGHSGEHLGFPDASEETELDDENDESERIAKKIVESVIAASVEIVSKDRYDNESPVLDESNNIQITDLQSTLDNGSRIGQAKKEKVQTEIKKKDRKTKKREKENDKEKGEELAGSKIENEKSKSEIKVKTKKFSHWFHKKDKPSKTVNETPAEMTSDAAKHVSHAANDGLVNEYEGKTLESIEHRVPHDLTVSQSSGPSSSFNSNLNLDVSRPGSALKAPTPADSTSDFSDALSPSSSISPTSPYSDSGEVTTSPSDADKSSGSSFLKKISIGSRLRTAILRKKSSVSSDDQDKLKPVAPPTKNVEPMVLTPPPRKVRQRRAENGSPESPRTQNTDIASTTVPQSTLEGGNVHLIKSALQPVSTENILTDDSGISDFTPQEEEDKSTSAWYEDYKYDPVNEIKETASTTATTHANMLTENSKVNAQVHHVSEYSNDDEDDTRPVSHRNNEETLLSEIDGYSKNLDHYSSVQSPSLVSTASITLRSVSQDEEVAFPNKYLTEDNIMKQEESKFHQSSVSQIEESSCASPESTFLFSREQRNKIFNRSASDNTSLQDNGHRSRELQNRNLSLAEEAVETNVTPSRLENDRYKTRGDLNFIAHTESVKGNLLQNGPHSQARTIAEYNIGEVTDLANETESRIHQDSWTHFLGNSDRSIIDGRPASELTAPHSWMEIVGTTSSSSTDHDLDAAVHDDSSYSFINKQLHKSLEFHSAGSNEQTNVALDAVNVTNYAKNVTKDESSSPHLIRVSNFEIDDDNSNNNHEIDMPYLYSVKTVCTDGHEDKSEVWYERNVDNSNKYSDDIGGADSGHADGIYYTLLNGDNSNIEDPSNRAVSETVVDTDNT